MGAVRVQPGAAKAPDRPGILQELVGDVRVVVTGLGRIDDAEFDAHVREAISLAPSVRVVLVAAEAESELTPTQRAKLKKAGLYLPPMVVLTDSILARGIMTAVRWLGGNVTGFAPNRFDEACDDLGIRAELRPEIRSKMEIMRSRVRRAEGRGAH